MYKYLVLRVARNLSNSVFVPGRAVRRSAMDIDDYYDYFVIVVVAYRFARSSSRVVSVDSDMPKAVTSLVSGTALTDSEWY